MKCEDCKIEVNWRRRRCDKCGKLLCINCLISDKHFANHHMPWKNETCLTPHAPDGGYASPEKLYIIGGCREHGFIVPRPPLVM